MKRTCRIFQVLRAWTAAVAIVALAALNTYAFAQSVVVVVNGDPITNYDIEQRTKLIQLGGQKPPARQDVIEELINEKLKIQMLRDEQIMRHMITRLDKYAVEYNAKKRSGVKTGTQKVEA